MSPAHAKVFAVNASATTSKAGSFPVAAFRLMLKRPGTDLSSILLGWLQKKESSMGAPNFVSNICFMNLKTICP